MYTRYDALRYSAGPELSRSTTYWRDLDGLGESDGRGCRGRNGSSCGAALLAGRVLHRCSQKLRLCLMDQELLLCRGKSQLQRQEREQRSGLCE